MPDDLLLIAAVSGRALATAARRAGFRPCVMDFFNDLDTRVLTEGRLARIDGEIGFDAAALKEGLQHLAGGERPVGFVYGAGFEDRPDILAELAQYWPLLGNAPEVVTRAKDPREIAALCGGLGIAHPGISREVPADPRHWLIKRRGGGGGSHIFPADRRLAEGEYYQRRVEGSPISVLVLGDGRPAAAFRGLVLGLSAQWPAPSSSQRFRFGGAVQPPDRMPVCAARLCDASLQIAEKFGLCGLNSIDFLVDGDRFHLLEINPRPGATLDIFGDADGALLRAHVEACRGSMPQKPLVFASARASAIVYAREDLAQMPELEWPAWCSDRQAPGTHVGRDEPICTVIAEADDASAARRLVAARLEHFLQQVTSKAGKVAAI